MAKNTITVVIKSRGLGLVSDAGPVHSCISLTYTYMRDGAGRFDATFPITDRRLLAAALKDTLLAFYVGGIHVFTGVVERRRRRHNKGRGTWIISGPCILGILAENSVGRLVIDDDTDGPQLILDATNVPNQTFTLDVVNGSGTTDVNVYKEFANETGLAALVKLAEMTGEHFRAATDGTLRVVWLQFDSPQTEIRLVDGGGPTLHKSRGVAIIEDIEVDDDGEGIVNRIYPVGAGQHEAELTLAAATMVMPAGYTMNTASNYIEWDAGQVFPSVRRALHKEFRSIAVIEPEYPYGDYWIEVDVFAFPGATSIDVEPLPVPLANGATLDLNGFGTVTITLTADAAEGDIVINVAALVGAVSDVDVLKYTIPFDPVPTENAANQLAAATLAMLEKLADPARRTAYRIVARNLPEAVKVGMTIPVRSHSYGVEIDDDLIILEITRSITSAGRAPVQLRVAAADWWENDADTEIARQLEEARTARSGSQPVAYTSITGSATPAPPMGHRAQHLEGGSDPLADTTPTAGLVPQADGAGNIAIGWINQASINTDNVTEGATNLFILPAELIKLAGIETAADVTDQANVGAAIDGSPGKVTPVGADKFAIVNSVGAVLGYVTYTDLIAALGALYVALTGDQSIAGFKTFTGNVRVDQLGIGLDPTTLLLELWRTAANANIRVSSDGGQAILSLRSRRNAVNQSVLQGVGGRGTFGTPLANINGDIPFQFVAYCDPDGSGAAINIGSVNFEVSGIPTGTSAPGRFVVQVVPDLSVTRADALTIHPTRRADFSNFVTHAGMKKTTATFAKTNSTLANITGLSVTVTAARTYRFRAVLIVDPQVTGGHKYAISGTATATSIVYHIQSFDDTTLAAVISSRQTALGGSAGQAGPTSVKTIIEGKIVVSAGGTLTVQFAQNVTNAVASNVIDATFEVEDYL
jgi:hypothetical protein